MKPPISNTKKVKDGGGKAVSTWGEMGAAKYNPRRIKTEALEALRRSLLTFGDISGAVYNKRTGNIVCGHQRRKALTSVKLSTIAWGEPYEVTLGDGDVHAQFKSTERAGFVTMEGGARIAVREVNWPSIFEKAANLAANNPHIAGEFTEDVAKLIDEIGGVMPKMLPALKLEDLRIDSVNFDKQEDTLEITDVDKVERTVEYTRDEIIFSSGNQYGFPDLRGDMIGDRVCKTTWAGGRELAPSSETFFIWNGDHKKWPDDCGDGVVGFYTDDFRFEKIWNEPWTCLDIMKERGLTQLLSPDFSMWGIQPIVVQMYQLFKARWCARFWQEKGIKVIPSLNWSLKPTLEWCFMGLPKKIPVAYVQCRTLGGDEESQARFIAGLLAGIKAVEPEKLCIYGSENRELLERKLPRSISYQWIPSWTMLRPAFRKRQGKDAWDKNTSPPVAAKSVAG